MTSLIARIWSNASPKTHDLLKPVGRMIAFWLALRVFSSLFISIVSSLRPLTDIEQRIALFPPTQPLADWFYRAFLSPWLRWDAVWYVRIVTQGYHSNDGTALFHPLYPWLAKPLYLLHLNPIFSLLLISAFSCLALLISYQYLSALDLPETDTRFSTLLLFFAPPAFVLFAPYTEALFIFLAILCLLWARQEKWWFAGLAGGLAALTRQQGMLLLIPVAWEMWEASGHDLRFVLKRWKLLFPLALIPIGYLSWIIYRALILSDFKLNLENPISFLSSMLLSPSGTNVVPNYGLVWPWMAIKMAVQKMIYEPDLDIWINLILGVGFLFLLVLAWKRMNWACRLYALAITILSFSFNTGPLHPYMGLPRHLLLAFPVFISLAPIFNSRWKRLLIITICAVGWFVLLFLYGFEAWVP